MYPKNINKTAFFSYNEKAKYILEYLKLDKSMLDDILNVLEVIEKESNKEYTSSSCINKLYFFDSIDLPIFLNLNETTPPIERLGIIILIRMINLKSSLLRSELMENKINFDNLSFIEKKNEYYFLLENEEIKVNKSEGLIYLTYFKHYILNEKNLTKLIDLLGLYIERRLKT